jgi:hypothetical protein
MYPGDTYLPRPIKVRSVFWPVEPQFVFMLPFMPRQYVSVTTESGRKSNSIDVESSTVSTMFGLAWFCALSGWSASKVSAA